MSHTKSLFNTDYFSYLLLCITVFLWGLAWPIGRFIVSPEFGPTIPPYIIVLLRYNIFESLLFLVSFIIEKNIGFSLYKKHWLEFSIMGLVSVTFYQFGYLYGETYTAASDASLVVATSPIIVLFVAAIMIHESITPLKIIGSVIAFLGVAVIVGFSPNTNVTDRYLGDLFVFFAAICYGTYTVLLRRLFNKYDKKPSSFHVLSWVSFSGLIFTIPFAILISPQYFTSGLTPYFNIDTHVWVGILYLALFSSLIAYLTYTEGVKRIGASRSAVFVNLVPVVGIAASVFIREKIDPVVHFLSFLCIFAGIMMVNYKKKMPSSQVQQPTSLGNQELPSQQID